MICMPVGDDILVTDQSHYVQKWVSEIRAYSPPDTPIMLVLTKKDQSTGV